MACIGPNSGVGCLNSKIREIKELDITIAPPQIVLMADDLGWADVSWHNPRMHTPHLARLAEEGVVLNRSYFHPKCSPSRAALLTGRHPHTLGLQRAGVGRFHPYGLQPGVKVLSEYLENSVCW